MRRSPLTRKTPLARGDSQLKRTKLKRGTPPLPKKGRKGKADDAELAKAKKVVRSRSLGYCEFGIPGVCEGLATHVHHRVTGHSDHRPAALAHVCRRCHSYCHAHPELAYARCWLVKHPTDATTVPIKHAWKWAS